MPTTDRARVLLAGTCAAAALALTAPAPAAAMPAPYVPRALLTISTTNPLTGGTLTITILNFDTGELIDIRFTDSSELLTTVRADKNGAFSIPITLPADLLCEQTLTATGRESHKVAQTKLLIGSVGACTRSEATTTAGRSAGRTAEARTAEAVTTPVQDARASTGTSSAGSELADAGTVGYSSAPGDDRVPAAAMAAVLGLATLGGIGFAHRRRRSSRA
jgi:hypothetical protein